MPLECEVARVQALGLPAVAWRHFPGRKFKHLALAAWQPVNSFAEEVAGSIIGAILLTVPIHLIGADIDLGLLALDDDSLELIRVTTSAWQDPGTFSLQSSSFKQIDDRAIRSEKRESIRAQVGMQGDAILIDLHGDPPLRIVVPPKYAATNRGEGLAIADALSGKPTTPFDYRVPYLALEKGIPFPPRPDLDLIIPATTPYERIAAELVPKILPDADEPAWILAADLAETRVQTAIASFAPDAPRESVLALLDTTYWGTGEWGILLTTQGFYYKVYGAYFLDLTKSLHQGVYAWWQIEDVEVDPAAEGSGLQITLIDDRKIRISFGRTPGIDRFMMLLNQVALFNEHLALTAK